MNRLKWNLQTWLNQYVPKKKCTNIQLSEYCLRGYNTHDWISFIKQQASGRVSDHKWLNIPRPVPISCCFRCVPRWSPCGRVFTSLWGRRGADSTMAQHYTRPPDKMINPLNRDSPATAPSRINTHTYHLINNPHPAATSPWPHHNTLGGGKQQTWCHG